MLLDLLSRSILIYAYRMKGSSLISIHMPGTKQVWILVDELLAGSITAVAGVDDMIFGSQAEFFYQPGGTICIKRTKNFVRPDIIVGKNFMQRILAGIPDGDARTDLDKPIGINIYTIWICEIGARTAGERGPVDSWV